MMTCQERYQFIFSFWFSDPLVQVPEDACDFRSFDVLKLPYVTLISKFNKWWQQFTEQLCLWLYIFFHFLKFWIMNLGERLYPNTVPYTVHWQTCFLELTFCRCTLFIRFNCLALLANTSKPKIVQSPSNNSLLFSESTSS